MKRNGYIDVIKFIFAIIVAEFHVASGIFPGGRIAVEGFFMITGFLMMKSLEKDPSTDNVALSTKSFLWRKYTSLFYFLLPAALLNFTVISIYRELEREIVFKRLVLLIFEIIPLNSTGLQGDYVVGISWYLSSMFIALAILYPLCKKFRQSFSFIACPLLVALCYGTLSHFYGSLAVNYQYVPETVLNTGILRAIAGCALGCLLYEASRFTVGKQPTVVARILFTLTELGAFAYFLHVMHSLPKSAYEFVAIIAIFLFLWIGINGLSYTSYLWNAKWTKPLGIASTLIVLSHYGWVYYLKKILGDGFQKTGDVWWYVLAIAISCLAVYLCSLLLKLLFSAIKKIPLWKKEASDT
jgi:hypothetical protein